MGKRQEQREPLTLPLVPSSVLVELYGLMEAVEPLLNVLLGPGEPGNVRFKGATRKKVLESLDAVRIGPVDAPVDIHLDLRKYSPELRADRRYVLLALGTGTAGLRTELAARATGKKTPDAPPTKETDKKGRVTNT